MQAMQAHRATADVALLQLTAPLKGKTTAVLGLPNIPIMVGSRFTIAGIGVTVRGDGKSGGTIRVAGLVATGRPGTLQIRLVDPVGQGTREGLGACTGDSGAPVFEDKQGGPVIVGVVSWSTGPNGAAGCGGMTGVTPLTLYRDWVVQTAREMGIITFVVPAKAGTHTLRPIGEMTERLALAKIGNGGYGSRPSPGRQSGVRPFHLNASPPCSRRHCSARSGRRRRRRACC